MKDIIENAEEMMNRPNACVSSLLAQITGELLAEIRRLRIQLDWRYK